MEETLTLEELYLLVDAKHRADHQQKQWQGALQGVEIEDYNPHKKTFEELKEKAAAEIAGLSRQEYALTDIIAFEDDDDED